MDKGNDPVCVCVCVCVCARAPWWSSAAWGQESQPCGFDCRQPSLSKQHRDSLPRGLTSLLFTDVHLGAGLVGGRGSLSILPFCALLSLIPMNRIHRIQWKTPLTSDALRHGCALSAWVQLSPATVPISSSKFSLFLSWTEWLAPRSSPTVRTHSCLSRHLPLMCLATSGYSRETPGQGPKAWPP